jgi:hypothetical protein
MQAPKDEGSTSSPPDEALKGTPISAHCGGRRDVQRAAMASVLFAFEASVRRHIMENARFRGLKGVIAKRDSAYSYGRHLASLRSADFNVRG